jgi:uncharacterized protein
MSIPDGSMRTAVITGGHSFDVPNFHRLFRSLDGIEPVIQHIDDWTSSSSEVRASYDAVVFYIMMMGTPVDDGSPWYAGKPLSALGELGRYPQGVVVLHHALLAYPEWSMWSNLVGIDDRKFGYHAGESVHVDVVDLAHPITKGLSPWDMTDETYTMREPREGSRVLLATDHPRSMKSIAWTRDFRGTRVFCLESGHDNATWVDANFREVLRRGILWSAGRI